MTHRENILWIFGDQHRGQALSYRGDPNARTPNIDALAGRGVTFTNAVAGCPWCTPFRGSLLTSRYIHECVRRTPEQMDNALPVVTDVFNDSGYDTAYFGKWHLNGHNNITYVPRENRGRFNTWIGYETDALTDKLLDYLRDRSPIYGDGRPFFAVLSVQPPHDPHVAPPEIAERYRPEDIVLRPNVPDIPRIIDRARRDLAGYYAQIENLDFNVGRIMRILRNMNLDKNTQVMFFSDHGDMHGSHGYVRKSSPWEEAISIPFIARPAGGLDVGVECLAPLNHVDIAPTTVSLCGLPVPEWMRIHMSLPILPILMGSMRSGRSCSWSYRIGLSEREMSSLSRSYRLKLSTRIEGA